MIRLVVISAFAQLDFRRCMEAKGYQLVKKVD